MVPPLETAASLDATFLNRNEVVVAEMQWEMWGGCFTTFFVIFREVCAWPIMTHVNLCDVSLNCLFYWLGVAHSPGQSSFIPSGCAQAVQPLSLHWRFWYVGSTQRCGHFKPGLQDIWSSSFGLRPGSLILTKFLSDRCSKNKPEVAPQIADLPAQIRTNGLKTCNSMLKDSFIY